MDHGTILTANEVAQLLKVNVETIYGLIAKDGLPATRVGGQWRFDEAEVRRWFKQQSQSSQSNNEQAA